MLKAVRQSRKKLFQLWTCLSSHPFNMSRVYCGQCCADNNQEGMFCMSPINISTAKACNSHELSPLKLSSNWYDPVDGICENTGYYLKFEADSSLPMRSVETHVGTYTLVQFHFHWGENDGIGSEHHVDEMQYALEAHFVLEKKASVPSNAVIGVLGSADSSLDVSGIWKQLSPREVQQAHSVQRISGLNYLDILPESMDYYHYNGSLTTPPYTTNIEWFLMKEPIHVPRAYLQSLRQIYDEQGKILNHNYREIQDIGNRMIFKSWT